REPAACGIGEGVIASCLVHPVEHVRNPGGAVAYCRVARLCGRRHLRARTSERARLAMPARVDLGRGDKRGCDSDIAITPRRASTIPGGRAIARVPRCEATVRARWICFEQVARRALHELARTRCFDIGGDTACAPR